MAGTERTETAKTEALNEERAKVALEHESRIPAPLADDRA